MVAGGSAPVVGAFGQPAIAAMLQEAPERLVGIARHIGRKAYARVGARSTRWSTAGSGGPAVEFGNVGALRGAECPALLAAVGIRQTTVG